MALATVKLLLIGLIVAAWLWIERRRRATPGEGEPVDDWRPMLLSCILSGCWLILIALLLWLGGPDLALILLGAIVILTFGWAVVWTMLQGIGRTFFDHETDEDETVTPPLTFFDRLWGNFQNALIALPAGLIQGFLH